MSFRRVFHMTFVYNLYEELLELVSSFKDLGVVTNAKSVVYKVTFVLGFIKRWSKDFDEP